MLKKLERVIAVLALLYFIFLELTTGFNQIFNYFWLISGCFFIVMSLFREKGQKRLWIFVIVCCLILGIGEAPIVKGSLEKPDESATYAIVLGAKVDGTRPSLALQNRLDAAYDYYSRNTDTVFVLTGGQGNDENITESACMFSELSEMGIPESQLLKEDKATTTYENIIFSAELIDKNQKIVLITSNYHVSRAKYIARRCGYTDISGCPAHTMAIYMPHYYVREFFAYIKEFIRE